jgi:hypothetical protein
MKGDFTRWNFKPDKHYHTVLKQQGRVDLDADWNEQDAIASHRVETETVDVVGPSGAPAGPAGGFALSVIGGNLQISKGRAYIDGLLVENEQNVAITAQPDFPNFKAPTAAGIYIAYLEAWLRHITALDDSGIREDALGGPDTSTRAKTLWQVNLLQAGASGASINCSTDVAAWNTLIAASTGTLAARAVPDSAATDPCIVPAQAGYRRLENQLYRVEIHNPTGTPPTFKWSRDNGSLAVSWTGQNGNDLTVSSTGPDSVLGFSPGLWVELVDDVHELTFSPGTFVQIANVQGNTLTINPATATGSVNFADFPTTPKIRRWDSPGLVPLTTGSWLDLEDGVQVQFATGTNAPGDYWLIPARTLKANVEWPVDASNNPVFQLPKGIQRHYCKLAIVQLSGTTWSIIAPCLPVFPPLTQITPGEDKGIHITGVKIGPNVDLLNDSNVNIVSVLREFTIIIACDGPIDPVSAQPPTCFVAVEIPYQLPNTAVSTTFVPANNLILGFQRLILPGNVRVDGNTIIWTLSQLATAFQLEVILAQMVQQQGPSRLLTRLTLKGNVIWALGDVTTYLDGEAFGVTRNDPDGAHIGLRLPQSGNRKRGGDFEMWFWLSLPVRPTNLGFTPNPVDAGQSSTGLITLNGPAPAESAVVVLSSVALDASGAQIAGVSLGVMPASITIAAGQTTGTFTVSQTTVPGSALSATLQVTAAYAGNTVQGNLTINRPLGLTSLTFNLAAVVGGTAVVGTLTLSGPAPANGAVVSLASNNALAKPPATVTIPAGKTSDTFSLVPGIVPAGLTVPVQITASFNGKSVQGVFNIVLTTIF